MLLREIGEFGLIERIARLLPEAGPDVVVGIGDDVAVLRTSGPDYLLATCDTQVEGVHFLREAITPHQLGCKVVAINVSDIAAMGGNPSWALVSLAVPPDTDVAFIEELYRGMREQAALAGAAIVGGNLSRLDSRIVIDLTLLGQIAPEHLILRSSARSGDSILVTGYPGESRAGLELIRRPELRVSDIFRRQVIARHCTPQPRLEEGRLLARSGLVHAMIDVSDGLLSDLGHICAASGTGALIEKAKVPVSPALSGVCAASGCDGFEWALAGGEDYELLFTAAPDSVPRIRGMLSDRGGVDCHEIGKITGEPGIIRIGDAEGKQVVVSRGLKGWDHFGGQEDRSEG